MSSTTQPKQPASSESDASDEFSALADARRAIPCRDGAPPEPSLLLTTPHGNSLSLANLYYGHTAFLLCCGPSLAYHDLSQHQQRGIATMAVNNAAAVVRPQLWCCVDDPGNFCDAIWYDPGITKFVPKDNFVKPLTVRDAAGQLVPSQHCVADMPAVFGYGRNEEFSADRWLHEPTINWGNHRRRTDERGNRGSRSVLYVAVRLLYYLGFRRIYLLGCDFRMEQGQPYYAFAQDRCASSVRGNNNSYRVLNERFTLLKPHFERAGLQIFNCTPDSGLKVFPYLTYEEALARATAIMPPKIETAGMYDRPKSHPD